MRAVLLESEIRDDDGEVKLNGDITLVNQSTYEGLASSVKRDTEIKDTEHN